jgi:predicted DNA-binding protein
MAREIAPFPVRLPAELREKLDSASKDAGRSLNSEIVDRLEKSFPNVDQMIINHRAAEIREIDLALLALHDEAQRLRTLLLQADDPHFRYTLKKTENRIRVLSHHRDMLDSDIANVRDGLVNAAIADD